MWRRARGNRPGAVVEAPEPRGEPTGSATPAIEEAGTTNDASLPTSRPPGPAGDPAARHPDGAALWHSTSQVGEPRLPRLDDTVRADLCVIGLGGSGLAAVAEGLARGLDVVGVDAGPVAGRASGRNGGFLLAGTARFHHDAVRHLGRERAVAWYRATMDELDAMVAASPDVRRVGSVRLAVDDAEFADVERQLEVMREDDLPVEEWRDGEDRGLLVPTDAAANPVARCRRLAADVTAAGATLFAHSPVRTISGRRVGTEEGAVECERVVVAVDGALGTVLPELAGRVRPVRLQMLGTEPTSDVELPRPVYARYGLDYWSQDAEGHVALGGGRDHGDEDEEGAAPVPSAAVQAHLDHVLHDQLGVEAAVTHRWAATVGFTSTGLPVCEQVRSGVWAVGGYSGTGNVVGSMLARVAVELAHRGSSDRADVLFDT